jgi:hypothetical protein
MPGGRVLILRILGGLAVVLVSFFGTLLVLDVFFKSVDGVRADHAKSIKASLENYRVKRGTYPFPFTGNPLSDLKKDLVDGGYLTAIPQDPGELSDKNYYYVSDDGRSYGLLFHQRSHDPKSPTDSRCLTGIGIAGKGWWGPPPACLF